MSQNIINKEFPTQRAISIVERFNKKLGGTLSKSDKFDTVFVLELQKEAEDIIALLFDSVIEGEFIRNSKIQNNIEELRKIYSSEDIENTINKDRNKYLSGIREKLYLIESLLQEYDKFINIFKFLINEEKDNIFIFSQNRKNIQGYEYDLFLRNLDLCIRDVQLNESFEYATKVEQLKSNIGIGGYLDQQKEKMRKKANLLLFKWYKRAEINKMKISPVIDGEEKGNYENEIISYGEEWQNIVNYINNHYFEGKERELKKSFQRIKEKDVKTYTSQEICLYIKYYKDIEGNLSKIDDLIEYLSGWKEEEKIEEKIDENEQNVRETIYRYAINNRFSLFTKSCDNIELLLAEYKKIKDNNKNYFPQYKFIQRAISLLQKEINQNKSIKEIERHIEYINDIYNKYKMNIEWSLGHSHFIFRTSLEESIIDGIFIYSSFVLPIPNKDARDKYEQEKNNFNTLKGQIEPLKKVNQLLTESKQINEDLKKNKVQVIELMGIFLAVIAFVMSSISGFQFVTSILSAVLFLVIFSTSLISFLLVLLLITRYNENILKKHKGTIIVFYIIKFILIFICAYFLSEEKNKDTNDNVETLQSVNTSKTGSEKINIDTIKKEKGRNAIPQAKL